MGAILNWNGEPNVPKALLRSHDEARAELVGLTAEPGRTKLTANRVDAPCSKP